MNIKVVKNHFFWLIIILILGFLVRLYKIDNPVADWHSWRQADTAAVSRNFFKEGFNPFYPKYDDMSPGTGRALFNPERFRFVEFPIYNSAVYLLYLLNGGVDERLARLVSILASLGSTVFIYLIVKRYWDKAHALLSSLLFAILPFNIFFSRVILPEPTLVFFSLGMFYFVDRWIYEDNKRLYFVALFFTICAFLIKPMAIFYLLPLIYSYYKKEGCLWPIPCRYLSFGVLAMTPLILWRLWISRHPEGIPLSAWLLNGSNIRFKPSFFRWIIGDRFGREIFSVPGTVIFFLGLLIKPKEKEGLLLHLLLLSSLLYLIIFATGNVQHDYYQTLIIPALVIFLARGFILLVTGAQGLVSRIWTIPLALLFFFLTIYMSWYEVKGLYQINNPVIVEAGKMADKILPKDATVIAPYAGDTAFLYQTNRYGFPSCPLPTKELIEKYGASYYISTTKDAKTEWVMKRYTVLLDADKYVIVDLRKGNLFFDKTDVTAEPPC